MGWRQDQKGCSKGVYTGTREERSADKCLLRADGRVTRKSRDKDNTLAQRVRSQPQPASHPVLIIHLSNPRM